MRGGQPSIAVLGVGAMGMLFAGKLSRVSAVTALGNWADQIETVARDGLWISEPGGRRRHCSPLIAYRTQDPAPFDLVLVLVKSYQTEAICSTLPALLKPDGLVITLQNGLGNLDLVAASVGSDRATQGVTAHGATLTAPGHLIHAGQGKTSIAALPARASLLSAAARLLTDAGIETEIVGDVAGLIWGKLAINAAINPLTALCEVPNGELARDGRLRSIMLASAREVQAVAAALGLNLPYKSVEDEVLRVAVATAENRSSMLQDIARGSRTEIDAISGAVVEAARSSGVPAPMNRRLYKLLREKESTSGQSISEVLEQLTSLCAGK